jgi:hypothetical protein
MTSEENPYYIGTEDLNKLMEKIDEYDRWFASSSPPPSVAPKTESTSSPIVTPTPTEIFVFGSNEAGRHGKGAAKEALRKHGAIYGKGAGRMGNSYAIPTKDAHFRVLPLETIVWNITIFVNYALGMPSLNFKVTAIGTGEARLPHEKMATAFRDAPKNCFFDERWKEYLPKKNFWGTVDE